MGHKRQHFIPQSYLKAWCDTQTLSGQEPYLWQFSKDGLQVKKKAPVNIFHENNMYTIEQPGKQKSLILEHGLSELESRFTKIRDHKISKGKSLSEEEHFILCTFIAAMHGRTKAQRDHLKKFWEEIIDKMDNMTAAINQAAPNERKKVMQALGGVSSQGKDVLHEEDVRKLAKHTMPMMLPQLIRVQAPLLVRLDMLILETTEKPGFITSDVPCNWFDPESCKRPPFFQGPALMYKTTEIRFPVSPRQLIILNRQGFRGRYIATPEKVDEFNRVTRWSSSEYFIVNSNIKKEYWFDPGVEPEDSWRNKHKDE